MAVEFDGIKGILLMIKDSSKVEIETYPGGSVMLYCHLHGNEAPTSIGVSARRWAKVKNEYPKLVDEKELG